MAKIVVTLDEWGQRWAGEGSPRKEGWLPLRGGFCPEINSLAGELGAPFRNTNARPCGRTCVPQHWNARKNPQETEHSRDFFDILDLLTGRRFVMVAARDTGCGRCRGY